MQHVDHLDEGDGKGKLPGDGGQLHQGPSLDNSSLVNTLSPRVSVVQVQLPHYEDGEEEVAKQREDSQVRHHLVPPGQQRYERSGTEEEELSSGGDVVPQLSDEGV